MNYRPVRNLVLLEAKQSANKSEGGLFLPESAVQTLNEGKIVAIGPDADLRGIEVNDEVVFAKHSDWKIEIDKKVYIAVQDSSILLQKVLPD